MAKAFFAFSVLGLFLLLNQALFAQNVEQAAGGAFNHARGGQAGAVLNPGYLSVDFEDAAFPPAGWTLTLNGTQYWSRSTSASAYGVGSACAKFAFYNAPTAAQQSLVTSVFRPSLIGDSLKFDHAYATYMGNQNDQLKIEFSIDGGVTWAPLVLLNGGNSGELVTAPGQSGAFTPAADQWKTKAFALTLGTNKLRFTAMGMRGNNLYLDNISVGAAALNDVGIFAFNPPPFTAPGALIFKTGLKNFGTSPQSSFTVTLAISPGGFTSTKTISNLAPDALTDVVFDAWPATSGSYSVKVYTQLTGDSNPANDTSSATITVTDVSWFSLAASPNAVSRSCAALVSKSGIDFIYQFGGGSSSLQTSVAAYNAAANTWSTSGLAAIPTAMNSATAVPVGDSTIYLFGGEASAGLGKTVKYNFYTNSWTMLAPMLTPVTDAVVLKSGDNVYVIGGNSGANDTATGPSASVQIYNISGNSYKLTTALPYGVALAGGGLIGNKIIISGGWYNKHAIDSTLIGQIDPADPSKIVWTSSPRKYPGGPIARMASYVKGIGSPNPGVVFAGGSEGGSTPTAKTFLYDGNTDSWSSLPDLPVARANMKAAGRGAGEIYVVAGYNGSSPVGNLDKLMLAPDQYPSLILGSPLGGEKWWIGSQQTIRWTANLVTNVKIEYSYDNGSSWATIATVPASVARKISVSNLIRSKKINAGYASYTWTVPNTPSTECRIRISDAANPLVYSISPGMFSMAVLPPTYVKFEEKFNGDNGIAGLQARGWTVVDLDGGGKEDAFFQGDHSPDGFPAYEGPDSGYVATNYDGANNKLINQWLISPPVTVAAGDSLIFWQRSPDGSAYDDTLYVRYSPSADTSVASFTQLMDRFKTSTNGWTCWGKPFPQSGKIRFAIQYYIVNGGDEGLYSDYVGIDWIRVTGPTPSAVTTVQSGKPKQFALEQNFPNPFNPSTVINYKLPANGKVTLKIYNTIGGEVATLVNEEKAAGTYSATFNASALPSGVYFYQFKAGNYSFTKKLVLMK